MNTSHFSSKELDLPGVLLITPKIFADERGFSAVPYIDAEFAELGILDEFIYEYASFSVKGVLRGLHYQAAPHAQNKLVRCARGEIFDVVADHDAASPTYGKYISVRLTGSEQSMLYIPGRYAHGFYAIEDAHVEYKMSALYEKDAGRGVLWSDPIFNITWPTETPLLSAQDSLWAQL